MLESKMTEELPTLRISKPRRTKLNSVLGDEVSEDDTKAFEDAIRALELSGGGRLVLVGSVASALPLEVKETTYRIRPINLTSNMELYLEEGVRLKGIDDADGWPVIPELPSYGQGRDHIGPRYTSLLHGEYLTNVSIVGADPYRSIIDGSGEAWYKRHKDGNETFTRGSLIEFMYTKNLQIHNVSLTNSPFWTVHPYACEDVEIRNVHINNPLHSPNTDGFDPDSSQNVRIEDSSYIGGDDCVAIKSGWDCFGVNYGRPSRNIHIRNFTCHVNQISLGSEMSGGIEHVLGEQLFFPGSAFHAIKVKTGRMRAGYIRNITFRDIYITGILKNAALDIDMDLYSNAHGFNPSCSKNWTPPHLPIFEDFVFENWDGRDSNFTGETAFYLHGISESNAVRNVQMKHIHLPEGNWNCSFLSNVTVANNTVTPWPPCPDVKIFKDGKVRSETVVRITSIEGVSQWFDWHTPALLITFLIIIMLSLGLGVKAQKLGYMHLLAWLLGC